MGGETGRGGGEGRQEVEEGDRHEVGLGVHGSRRGQRGARGSRSVGAGHKQEQI